MSEKNYYYVLDSDGKPLAVDDIFVWGKWFENANNRIVAKTKVREDVEVSTVFLGIDHSFSFGTHTPILWETMIFGGDHDMYQERYTSRIEAVEGHEKAVALARGN